MNIYSVGIANEFNDLIFNIIRLKFVIYLFSCKNISFKLIQLTPMTGGLF